MQVDPPLANYVTGVDASARLAGGSEAPCAPALVASGMRYGPARHRIFHADGASTLIEDEGEALRIGSICSDRYDGSLLAVAALDSMTAQVMGDYQSWRDAWWIGAESEHVDEALLERLRALGYVE